MRLFHKLALAIVLMSLLALLFPISVAVADEIVTFPDPNLEAAIRQALGKPTGSIYESDLMTLTELYANDRGIGYLTGLEHCTNLTRLYLQGNRITDISPLASLTSLTSLGLTSNLLSDISPLSTLTILTRLQLERNQIGDISPLSTLTSLTYLDLYVNQISNISPLASLIKLTSLNLYLNRISDLSPLSTLTSLKSLNLENNRVSDLSPLSTLTSLTSLNIDINGISDLSPLSSLTSLTHLDCYFNRISDLSPLASLTNLTELQLSSNQISDISSLANLTNLTSLTLGGNPISDISPLSALTRLTSLWLGYNQISDISPLASLTSLRILSLNNLPLSDLSPLASLISLTRLDLYDNQIISDISPLAGLTYLTILMLDNNQISDISPLASLTRLTDLGLLSNRISDIGPLVNNPGLSTGAKVYLSDNPLSDTSANVYIPQLRARGVTVYYTPPNQPPRQPNNTSPSSGATGISLMPTIQSSAFSDPDVGDTHATSQWQVTTTSGDYSSPVFDSGTDAVNLTSITIPPVTLTTNTTYFWHGRCQDNHGAWSTYSTETSFTTIANLIVTFTDPNLEAAIRQAIGKPTGDILQSDLIGLTTLNASDRVISDLTGLEWCTNLTDLDLGWTGVSDITQLSSLTNLTHLDLSFNEISDISPLSDLTSLTWLNLWANQISDISPLSNLADLNWLDLAGNGIVNISPLSHLTNLTWLQLVGNPISDISPLSVLTNLTWLGLDATNTANLSPLSSLTSLTELSLCCNGINDISPISGLSSLTRLYLENNQLVDISPLSGLTSLTYLMLSQNSIVDISPLSGLTSMDSLYLDQNLISDLSPLSGPTCPTYIQLDRNQVSDVLPLVSNAGFIQGHSIILISNPLSSDSTNVYIPQLQARGVMVVYHLPENGMIQGMVERTVTGDPIPGATVVVNGTAMSATSIGNGWFCINNVPPSNYTVTASAAGYISSQESVTVTAGQTTYLSLFLNPTLPPTPTPIPTLPTPTPAPLIGQTLHLTLHSTAYLGFPPPINSRPLNLQPGDEIIQFTRPNLIVGTNPTGSIITTPDSPATGGTVTVTGDLSGTVSSYGQPIRVTWDGLGGVEKGYVVAEFTFNDGLGNTFSGVVVQDTDSPGYTPPQIQTNCTGYIVSTSGAGIFSGQVLIGAVSNTVIYDTGTGIQTMTGTMTLRRYSSSEISGPQPVTGTGTDTPGNSRQLGSSSGSQPTDDFIQFTGPLITVSPGSSAFYTEGSHATGTGIGGPLTGTVNLDYNGINVVTTTVQGYVIGKITATAADGTASGILVADSRATGPNTAAGSGYIFALMENATGAIAGKDYYITYDTISTKVPPAQSWTYSLSGDAYTLTPSTPQPPPPTVTTNTASNVFGNSAIMNGHLDSQGTAPSVDVSFQWTTDAHYQMHGDYDNETSPPWPMNSTGAFSFSITGLMPDTTYHFRAKAVGDGTAYGSDVTFTTAGPGSDGDGVPSNIEDAAPNNGDANYDGTPDSQQAEVTSLPNAANGEYATIESPAGTNLTTVAAVNVNSLPSEGKPNLVFPYGLLAFDITGINAGSTVWVTLRFENPVPANSEYWKYGPTPDNPSPNWYQIQMSSNDGDDVIQIPLVDGGLGDDDLTANGIIIDQGGPGNPLLPGGGATYVQVFPSVYVGIGAALGAGIIAYFVRRRFVRQG